MRVVLGEDQCLGHGRAAGEDLGEQSVAERLQHGADLIGGGDGAVELAGGVVEILVQRLVPLGSGAPVDLRHDGAGLDRRTLLADLRPDPVDVEVDVDVVRHRLRVGVLGDEVLLEEPEGLLARRGGQTDDVGVEVLQHPAPLAVDRAVRLVHDDQVERLGRDVRVVGDRHWLVGHPAVQVRVVGIAGLLVAQRLEHPLDRRDRDAGRVRHRSAPDPVDVVQLGELPAVVGRLVILELGHRLLGQVVAVDQEQDAVEAAVLEQPVRQGDGGVGLAGAGGHLHQAPIEPLLTQTRLDAVDRGDLRWTQRPLVKRRQVTDLAAPRRVLLVLALEDVRESGRLGDVEDPPRRRFGVVAVGEVGFGAAGLEDERQPPLLRECRELHLGRQALGVLARLPLHARKRGALGFGLDHSDDSLVDVKQVVGAAVARLERDFADCDALRGEQVHRLLVLHRPAGLDELPVYEHAGARFGRYSACAFLGTHDQRLTASPKIGAVIRDQPGTGAQTSGSSGGRRRCDRHCSCAVRRSR